MPAEPMFPFIDLADRPALDAAAESGADSLVGAVARAARPRHPRRRPSGPAARCAALPSDATVAASLRKDAFYRRLIEPLAVAALNTPPDVALVRLLARGDARDAVPRRRRLHPGGPARGSVGEPGRSRAWPGWRRAAARDHRPARRRRCGIEAAGSASSAPTDGPMPVEAVVLAVPPWIAADLLPGLACPTEFQAILNIHFRVDADPGPAGFIGLVGGTAEWVFVKRGHVSVTISAANRMVDQDAEAIAQAVWPDVRAALGPGRADAALARGEGAARHLRRHRGAGEAAAAGRAPTSPTWCSPATGPPPGCPARSKVPSGPAEPRPRCCSPPEDAAMPGETLLPNQTVPDAALARRDRAGRMPRWRGGSTRTGTGCSSWRRMRRSRPNTCCWSTSSTASTRRWRRRSASICGRSRARTAAGRCSMTARSTCRPA